MYRKIKVQFRDHLSLQFILPTSFRQRVMLAWYNDVGHLSLEGSLGLLKEQFYWPNMAQDMERHVKQCDRCLRYKSR